MEYDVLIPALSGFGGAVVGGLATVLGTYLQQRIAAETAERERVEATRLESLRMAIQAERDVVRTMLADLPALIVANSDTSRLPFEQPLVEQIRSEPVRRALRFCFGALTFTARSPRAEFFNDGSIHVAREVGMLATLLLGVTLRSEPVPDIRLPLMKIRKALVIRHGLASAKGDKSICVMMLKDLQELGASVGVSVEDFDPKKHEGGESDVTQR